MLGTHKRARESILPLASDMLSSIYEENREARASIVPTEEIVSNKKVEADESRERTCVFKRDDAIKISPVSHFEPVRHSDNAEDEDLSMRSERTLPIRRLDSLFSSPSNDDSFVNHETMLANDSSVLATTLIEVSPEETNTLADELAAAEERFPENGLVTATEQRFPENDLVPATESVPINDEFDAKFEEESVFKNHCDGNLRAVDQMIEFLNKRLWEKEEFHSSCTQQIEELQKKLNESSKEVEDMKAIKQFLLKKLRVSECEDEAEVKSDSTMLMLPPKTVSNQFVPDSKSQPSRQTRAPRASVLLTPHSMSLSVQSQFQNLLK